MINLTDFTGIFNFVPMATIITGIIIFLLILKSLNFLKPHLQQIMWYVDYVILFILCVVEQSCGIGPKIAHGLKVLTRAILATLILVIAYYFINPAYQMKHSKLTCASEPKLITLMPGKIFYNQYMEKQILVQPHFIDDNNKVNLPAFSMPLTSMKNSVEYCPKVKKSLGPFFIIQNLSVEEFAKITTVVNDAPIKKLLIKHKIFP